MKNDYEILLAPTSHNRPVYATLPSVAWGCVRLGRSAFRPCSHGSLRPDFGRLQKQRQGKNRLYAFVFAYPAAKTS